jgi:hypothetical protein
MTAGARNAVRIRDSRTEDVDGRGICVTITGWESFCLVRFQLAGGWGLSALTSRYRVSARARRRLVVVGRRTLIEPWV